jgi:hypothetical protein
MRGRAPLVAAALLQLLGAAIFVVTGGSLVAMGASGRHARPGPFFAAGAVTEAAAIAVLVASVALLRGRRWGWIASLALCSVAALAFGGFAVALGDAKPAVVLPPLVVTIGLLVAGRRAAGAATASSDG